MRVVMLEGPGDVVQAYEHWRRGRADPSQTHVTWTSQFLDTCTAEGIHAFLLSWNSRAADASHGDVAVQNRPMTWPNSRGALFHVSRAIYTLRLMITAVRFRADCLIVTSGVNWFLLSPLRLLGVRVVPHLNCVMWRTNAHPPRSVRILRCLDRLFFRFCCTKFASMSDEISSQVRELATPNSPHEYRVLPYYEEHAFRGVLPPSPVDKVLRVLFVGRIEASKGVLDLVEMALGLSRLSSDCEVSFEICGDGAAMGQMRTLIAREGLEDAFRINGHCNQDQMRDAFSRSHVVIAPTRTSFVEGFNMVVVEGVLAGRPVVTSRVCPAISHVRSAVIEAVPDDVGSYVIALHELRSNASVYEQKCRAAGDLRSKFMTPENSWGAVVRDILGLGPERGRPVPRVRASQQPASGSPQGERNV